MSHFGRSLRFDKRGAIRWCWLLEWCRVDVRLRRCWPPLSPPLQWGFSAARPHPAGALVVDQPLSAVGSPMWQTNNTVWALDGRRTASSTPAGSSRRCGPRARRSGIGEVARNRIAAFNANTGALITTFNPNANGMVYDLDVSNDGTKLYVAGSFTTIGGQTRQRIARLNLPSGTRGHGVDGERQRDRRDGHRRTTTTSTSVATSPRSRAPPAQRIAKLNTTNGNVVTAFNADIGQARSPRARSRPNGSRLLVGGENDDINGVLPGGDRLAQPDHRRARCRGPQPASRRGSRNGGCDANLTDITGPGHDRLRHGRGAEPGLLGGLLRRQHRRRLARLQRAVPRRHRRPRARERLDVPRARTTTTARKNAGRVRRPEQRRTTSSGTASRRTASPTAGSATGRPNDERRQHRARPPRSARRSSRPTAPRSSSAATRASVNGSEPAGPDPLQRRPAGTRRPEVRPPRGHRDRGRARCRSAPKASRTTTTACSPTRSTATAAPRRSRRQTAESWPWSRPVLRFKDSGLDRRHHPHATS